MVLTSVHMGPYPLLKEVIFTESKLLYFQHSEACHEKRLLCAQNNPRWQHSCNVMSFPSRDGTRGFVYFQYGNALSIVSLRLVTL